MPQLITKTHLQRELQFSLWRLNLPAYQFVRTGMNPAVVLPKNKTKAFATQGLMGSSVCWRDYGGGGLPRGCGSKLSITGTPLCTQVVQRVCDVRCSLVLPSWSLMAIETVLVSNWDYSPSWHPHSCTFDSLWPDHLYELLGVSHTHWTRGHISFVLSFHALKGYSFESHTVQEPPWRVTFSSSANRRNLCMQFKTKQDCVFN